MKPCRDTTELVTAYLERRLPLMTRFGIWFHIAMCRPCRRYFRQLEQIAAKTGEVPPLDMPEDVAARLDDVFEAAAAEWKADPTMCDPTT